MSKRKSAFHNSANDVSNVNFCRLYDDISLLCKGRFKWSNLPKGIESRHIEKFLYEHGQVAFFFDEKLGYKCLPCSDTGMLNIYGDPLQFFVLSENGEGNTTLNFDEMVRIQANDHCSPNIRKVKYYTEYINKIETTMSINLEQQKFPYVIPTTEKNRLTMKNIFEQFKEGIQAIFVDDRMSNGGDLGIQVLRTDAPFLLHDLQKHKNETLNEMYSWLGINNTNQDKKERMLVDEVNVNNSYIQMNLENEFRLRELACSMINEKYGLNIQVEKSIDLISVSFKGDETETEVSQETKKKFFQK